MRNDSGIDNAAQDFTAYAKIIENQLGLIGKSDKNILERASDARKLFSTDDFKKFWAVTSEKERKRFIEENMSWLGKYELMLIACNAWLVNDMDRALGVLSLFDGIFNLFYGGVKAESIYYRALIFIRIGKYEPAKQLIDSYLHGFPYYDRDETAWLHYGNACCFLGQYDEALEAYDKAVSVRPDMREAIINSAIVAQKLGDSDTANDLARTVNGERELASGKILDNPLAPGGSLYISEDIDIFDIPIFINARDRVVCLSRLVDWLNDAGYSKIYILDNDSTYEPLLDYYKEIEKSKKAAVFYLRKNYGHRALWDCGVLERLKISTPYIYTDPDVLPVDGCPKDFVRELLRILIKYPFLKKAGPGIVYEDITFAEAEQKKKWEGSLYDSPMEKNVYFSILDTTLALYRPYYHYGFEMAARTTGRIMVRHLPWYYDLGDLPEDERYYMQHANASSSIKTEHIMSGNAGANEMPLVSVMIPTYNRPLLFRQTLESAMMQTYKNIEIIVCDNSTNDDTENLMKQNKYIDDPRVTYVRNRDAKTKEENFAPFERLARGEFFQWCMDDDLLAPDKIERMIKIFMEKPNVKLVSSRRGEINEKSEWIAQMSTVLNIEDGYAYYYGGELGQAMLMDSNNVIGEPSAVLFRRDDLKHHYFHAESRGYYVLSDVAMWLELLEQGDAVIFRDPLSYYRWHEEQEGRQPDVILLARIEWFGLMKEYYERGIYLKERGDYVRAVRGLVQDAEKHLLKKALPHASEEMKKRYMACLDEMRGIAPSGHERYMRQMRAKNIFFGALEELQRKKYKDAVNIMSSFQKCMSDDGENTPFWNMYYMGLAEYGLGNYSEAEGLFYGYLNAVPMAITDETAWFYLGNACAREGKWRAAVAAYDKATKIRPRFFEADGNRKLIEQKLMGNNNGSAMSAPQGGKLEIAEEIIGGSYALPKGYSIFDIPIFINCRDRVLCLKRLLGWLIEAGYRNIYLLDNDSTYGPLLEYYDEIAKNKNIKVIRLGKNYGFTALWLSGTLQRLDIRTPYIYTDPDVIPSESCPKDFVKTLWDILEKYPLIKKAGPGLIYDDITYFNRDNTIAWESQWYEEEIEKGRHFASIDTTLALYRNYYHYSLDISVRTSGDVMMRHLPWYYDMDNLPEDERYYMEHATSAASIKTEHEKSGNE